MPRPSVILALKQRLKVYCKYIETEYQGSMKATANVRYPIQTTLKANMSAITFSVGMTTGQQKYLYERDELRSLIDMITNGQILQAIGARTMDAADNTAKQRMILQQ